VKPVDWTPRAKLDSAEVAYWYAQQGDVLLAESFLAELEAAVELISGFPQAGSMLHARVFPDLPTPLRFVRLKRFERYLLYYVDRPGRLDIVRVWDASRGLDALMIPGDDTE